MAIFKFILGNLKKRKSYSIIISILVFLAGLILTVTLSTVKQAGESYDKAFNNIEGPHLLYWFMEDNYKPEFQQWFKDQKGVQSVNTCRVRHKNGSTLEYKGKKLRESTDYNLVEYNPNEHMRLIDSIHSPGKTLSSSEVYLPYIFKTVFDISVGDTVGFEFEKDKMTLKVAGFIEDPISGGELDSNKVLFISDTDMKKFMKLGGDKVDRLLQMRVHMKTFDEAEVYKLGKNFMKEYGSSVRYVITYSSLKSLTLTLPNVALVIMITFALILCIITFTIMRYAILATIEADYLNIGIVKALGFTPLMVQLSITGQYALLAFVSGILSLITGIIVSPFLGNIILKSSGLYFDSDSCLLGALLTVLSLVFIISVFSYITASKTKKISPVSAIARGISPVYFSSRLDVKLEKLGFLPFDIRMSIKQVLTKYKRYILLILISALLAYSLVFSFGLVQLFSSERAVSMVGGEFSDIEVDAPSKAVVENLVANIKEDYKVAWATLSMTSQLDVDGERTIIRIKDDFDSTGELTTIEGRHPKHDNEVAISYLMMQRLGKGVGEYLSIKGNEDIEKQFIITGIFQTLDEGGVYIRMLESGMKVLYPEFELKEAYIRLESHNDLDKVISEMRAKYTGYQEISNERKQTQEKIDSICSVFSAISKVVLILTILMISFIILLIMRITVYSETNEMGIYKALGFTSGRIRLQLALRFVLVTFVGGIIGVLLEIISGSKLLSIALRGIGMSSMNIGFSKFNAVFPIITISILALLSAYASSGKTKNVSVYKLINE